MNCKTCNIAAPQYELFDGLCGKCLLRITRDLLAVIHRDGGQYTEQHGLEVSAKSAGEISIGRLVTAEESQKQAAAMREALILCQPKVAIFSDHTPRAVREALASDAGRDYVKRESLERVHNQAAAMREALEKARADVVRFLVPHRFRLSDSWLDFFVEENLVMFDAFGFVKPKPIEEDAGRDYVHKEKVKPLLDALSAYRTLLYQAGESTVLADEAFMQARRIGLLEDK